MNRRNLVKYLHNEEYRINAQNLFDKLSEAYAFLNIHKPSLGNFGEHILRDFLKTVLPNNIGVTQGFVQGKDGSMSSQCDIIIYMKNIDAIIKSFGDIYIISNKNVLSTIEVKTRIQRKTFESSIKAFKKLAKMGCYNNNIFIYNTISPQALCSYLYPTIAMWMVLLVPSPMVYMTMGINIIYLWLYVIYNQTIICAKIMLLMNVMNSDM